MEYASKIIEWIKENAQSSSDVELTEETNYFEAGIVDSMTFVGLIMFAEELTGRDYSPFMDNPELLNSVSNLLNAHETVAS